MGSRVYIRQEATDAHAVSQASLALSPFLLMPCSPHPLILAVAAGLATRIILPLAMFRHGAPLSRRAAGILL